MPSDYTFAANSLGDLFYKTYDKMPYVNAKRQCESDGAFLAIPRSEAENDFITGLLPNQNMWIGINDIEREGRYVAVDGGDIPYTNWYPGEPNNHRHGGWCGFCDEDGVMIYVGGNRKTWNDSAVRFSYKFICIFNIAGEFKTMVFLI